MPTKIKLPSTIDEATADLDSINGLLTVTEWKRAAIVWAFTRTGKAGRPSGNLSEIRQISGRLTISQFAKLDIVGLTERETVGFYRSAWKLAMKQCDAPDVGPGDSYEEITLDWPPILEQESRSKRRSTQRRKDHDEDDYTRDARNLSHELSGMFGETSDYVSDLEELVEHRGEISTAARADLVNSLRIGAKTFSNAASRLEKPVPAARLRRIPADKDANIIDARSRLPAS